MKQILLMIAVVALVGCGKNCPECKESVKAKARKCIHCEYNIAAHEAAEVPDTDAFGAAIKTTPDKEVRQVPDSDRAESYAAQMRADVARVKAEKERWSAPPKPADSLTL